MTALHTAGADRPRVTIDLEAALRAHAGGLLCTEAAVELLIGHRSWLLRTVFVERFVEELDVAVPGAIVDWSGAVAALQSGGLPCSSSEAQMLRIAASLAEGVEVDLRDAVCGLDAANAALVADALLHAAGHRRRFDAPRAR